MLEQAVIAFLVENDVVEQLDPKGFPGSFEGSGHLEVFPARHEVPGGVIVGYNHRRSAVGDGIGKYFARVDMSLIHQTDGYGAHRDYFIRSVERDAEEVFLFAVGQVADEGEHLGREGNPEPLRADAASGELDRRGDQRRLGLPHSFDLLQLLHIRMRAALVQCLEDPACHREHIMGFGAAAQKDGDELDIGERRRAFAQKLLPGPLALGHLRNSLSHGFRPSPFAGRGSLHDCSARSRWSPASGLALPESF